MLYNIVFIDIEIHLAYQKIGFLSKCMRIKVKRLQADHLDAV